MAREYKDSGIEWIGRIPKDWKVCRFKSYVSLVKEKVYDINLPKINLENIESYSGKFIETDSKYDGEGYLFKPGDILFGKLRPYLAKVFAPDYIGQAVGDFYVFRPSSKIEKDFLKYAILSDSFISNVNSSTYGTKMPRANWDFISNVYIAMPSMDEQRAIASYLDRKCAEIDSLVELQEQMIAQLTDYKQSVITEAATKGLNPEAELVPSGIDWIGDVPKGWKVCRIKDIFRLRTGTTPKGFEQGLDSQELVNWFTPSDVAEMNCELSSSERHLSKEVIEKEGIELNPAGSLIFVGIGNVGKIGYATVEGYSNQQITTLIPKPNKCFGKYSYYYMIADRKRIRDNAFYTILPIINNSYLSGVKSLLPPLEEQHAIASYLDAKCREIDSLIDLKRQKIEALKDYKKSIIFEAVTGKTDIINYP